MTSIMFGHAKSEDIVKEILAALEKLALPVKQILSLGMDGPNVNKSVLEKINRIKRDKGFDTLVQCPASCLLHICHNSFWKGLEKFGVQAEELALNLYYFFNKSSCRREDLFAIEESLGLDEMVLLHHVQSRWLSLVPVLECIEELRPALKKFFTGLPVQERSLKAREIITALDSLEVEAQAQFIINVKPIFDEFLTKFQLEAPMVYVLYPSCVRVLKTLMGRLVKSKLYVDKKGKALAHINVQDMEVQLKREDFRKMQGQKVLEILQKLPEGSATKALMGMKEFYKAVIQHLQKKFPLEDVLLEALTCLNPQEQRAPLALQNCKVVAQAMPSVQGEEVKIEGEWLRYQEMKLTKEDKEIRVDHFWQKMFKCADDSGESFAVLAKMVKCALALCHSNADVERSLSVNSKLLTKNRVSLNQETIVGLRAVKDGVQDFGGVHKVVVSLDILKAAENARRLYQKYLDEEQMKKRQKEAEKKKADEKKKQLQEKKHEEAKLEEAVGLVKEQIKETKEEKNKAKGYIEEGMKKSTEGMKANNMMDVRAGHSMIEFGAGLEKELSEKLDALEEEKEQLESKLYKRSAPKKAKFS